MSQEITAILFWSDIGLLKQCVTRNDLGSTYATLISSEFHTVTGGHGETYKKHGLKVLAQGDCPTPCFARIPSIHGVWLWHDCLHLCPVHC